MKEKLLKLIKEEDKKNPLSDEQFAGKLSVNRAEVTQLRQLLGIPDSRKRRKPLLISEIKKILAKMSDVSDRTLTAELNKNGFEISRYSVSNLLRESGLSRQNTNNGTARVGTAFDNMGKEMEDPFSSMIGWDKSLRVKVEQAKAAILYPPNGLHTLIVGTTGVGKSELAECMYKFALQAKELDPQEYPFVVFNCADYAENPQLLLAQLFGYKKGAFTGAEADKDGLVDKADGGILFLDEVHRLPSDGQEILFQLIDKGKYRRLGETDVIHEAKVMIIAATTEDIEKSLLGTFRRRIPMIIELSPLSLRPVEERYEIIKMFFHQEATRINKKIIVNYNALKTVLVYNCIGNIGQLRSDIQVACARGFLNFVAKGNEQDCIIIDYGTLPVHVTKGLFNTQWDRAEIEKFIADDLVFLPNTMDVEEVKESLYTFPQEIYKNIEEEYQKLLKQGLSDDVINRIIGDDLESRVKRIIKQIEKNKHKIIKQDLKAVVRPEIADLVHEMSKVAKTGMGEIDDTLFYCLATHLNASVERIKSGRHITNPKIQSVKKDYPREYKIAADMAALTNFYLGFDLPEDEIGFIAMYIRNLAHRNSNSQDTIGIVIITHGHVAEGMANVANHLLGVDIVKPVEMSLDEKPEIAYERTLDAVAKADRGKGVLLLVDMGSPVGFGSLITKKIGIHTRTVTRVDTLMVIDAVRKALLAEADLNTVADSLIKGKNTKVSPFEDTFTKATDKTAIISLCLTGEGTARHIKNLMKDKLQQINKNIEIVTLGVLDDNDILEQIEKIKEEMDVLAIVGTINPRCPDVPFFSSTDVLKECGIEKLRHIVRKKYNENRSIKLKEPFNSVFDKDLILVNKEVRDKREALKLLSSILIRKGCVSPNFIDGVLERERFGTTAIGSIMAIPHGRNEDIIIPAIGIITLKKPIEWNEGQKVPLIFMLALNENSKHEFKRINKIIKNEDIAKQIKRAKNAKEVINILENV